MLKALSTNIRPMSVLLVLAYHSPFMRKCHRKLDILSSEAESGFFLNSVLVFSDQVNRVKLSQCNSYAPSPFTSGTEFDKKLHYN